MSLRKAVPIIICTIVVFGISWQKIKKALTEKDQGITAEIDASNKPPLNLEVPLPLKQNKQIEGSQQNTRSNTAAQSQDSSLPKPGSFPFTVSQSSTSDSFSLRKLNLPRPNSIVDLEQRLTKFAEPMLSGNEAIDGSVTSYFRGFFQAPDSSFQKVMLFRHSKGVELSIEGTNGTYAEWSSQSGQIKLFNFNNDPYSLVIKTPDSRTVYLKYHDTKLVDGYVHGTRAYIGWVIGADKESLPVVVIDAWEGEWPELELIKAAMPQPLPRIK